MAVRRYFGIIGSKVLSIWGVININNKLRQNPWESLEEEPFQKITIQSPITQQVSHFIYQTHPILLNQNTAQNIGLIPKAEEIVCEAAVQRDGELG